MRRNLNQSKLAINTKACTTRPLVQAGGEGGKLLTLPNFILNFKAKYLQQYEAEFEPI